MDVVDRLALRPDTRADVRAEERGRHQPIRAHGVAERLEPLPGSRDQPVAHPQVEGVIEPVIDPAQVHGVVQRGRREDERRELEPGIETEARELDEIAIDFRGAEALDRQTRSRAVDPVVPAACEIEVPRLGEEIEPQFERELLLVPGPDQYEHAPVPVIVADEEPGKCGASRIRDRRQVGRPWPRSGRDALPFLPVVEDCLVWPGLLHGIAERFQTAEGQGVRQLRDGRFLAGLDLLQPFVELITAFGDVAKLLDQRLVLPGQLRVLLFQPPQLVGDPLERYRRFFRGRSNQRRRLPGPRRESRR